jgi:hypothetical protein
MTVLSTNYGYIEEVWSNQYLAPQLQKKPKKQRPPPQNDPICDLYEMGQNHYSESDIISYANSYNDRPEKSKHQKGAMKKREKVKFADIDDTQDAYEAVDVDEPIVSKKEEDFETYEEIPLEEMPAPRVQTQISKPPPMRPQMYDVEGFEVEKRDGQFNYLDVALYIISGIILIFMMEQFVKIGAMLS